MGEEKRTEEGRALRLVIDNLDSIKKELKTLNSRTSSIEKTVNASQVDTAIIKKDINNLQSKDSEIADTVKKHDNALYGNGKPGLLTDMALIKKSIKPIEDTKEKFFNTAFQWVVILGTLVIAFLSGGKIIKG